MTVHAMVGSQYSHHDRDVTLLNEINHEISSLETE